MLSAARTGVSARARTGPVRWPLTATVETQILLVLVVVAAVLRFATLASQSYWLDESQAAHELSLSFGSMLGAWSRAEWNPPLYLVLAWPWARVFGTGEVGLRALSAVLGVGLVPLLYLCGAELVSRRAGLVAAALAAVNPFMIWYSQEAREYMLLAVLCTASLLFFARAWRMGRNRDVVWWAIFSALAVATQYFAGFLVAAEGLLLVYRLRSRVSVGALVLQAVVLAPLVPHVLPRLQSQSGFIVDQPLSLRLQQVPVTFALNTLYRGSLVSDGLLGAAAAAAVVIALLLIGADDHELRGAGLAAGLAAVVLVVPLLSAVIGHDNYVAVGLTPAWPPLAVLFGAACTARRARVAGAALTVGLVAMFVYAGVTIDSQWFYQRPDWRGVAAALGAGRVTRAIVAYPGQFAAGPLSVYLPRVPWSGPGSPPTTGMGPATIRELDIVGNAPQQLGRSPLGMRLIASRTVDGYVVDRFSLSAPWSTAGPQIVQRADALLSAGPSAAPSVLIQPPSRMSS